MEENSALFNQANSEVEAMNGFVAGGGDRGFSKNTIDKSNDTLTFGLVNPTTSKLSVSLMGMNSGITLPVNPPPSVISTSIPLLAFPQAGTSSIATPNNTIYTSNPIASTVQVIDCFTNTVITTIFLPVGFGPNATAYCPVNNQMYVGSQAFPQIIRIDCATNTIVGVPIVTTLPFSSFNTGLIYNSVKNTVYGVDNLQQNIIEVSCSTNLQVSYILGVVTLESIAFNPILNRLYINNGATGNLDVLDCFTNAFLPPIILPINPSGGSIVFCSSNNSVYVASFITDDMVRVNCVTSLVVGLPVPLGVVAALGLGYNPINNVIYAAGQVSDDFVIFNVATNAVSAPTALGLGNTSAVFYNQNNNSVYFIRQLSNTAEVYAPILPPSVVVTLQGSVTPAEIFNDLQGKPLFFSGLKMILSDLNQLFNNMTVQYTSITGKVMSSQLQPTNNVSPSNRNGNIVDITDFEFAADTNSQVSFDMEPLSTMTMAFSLRRQVSNVSFDSPNNNSVEKRENVRISGNPILDILLVQDEEEYQRKKSK